MATGLSKNEKLGKDAITAASPHRDPHPLPAGNATPVLEYANRLSKGDMAKRLDASFQTVAKNGISKPATIKPNSLVLSDNLFALHDMAASGQRVTLFYLDPPYNTGMDFHSRGLEHSYNDDRDVAVYVEIMRRRLFMMREVMTDNGSIYVHIGHQMLFHLKMVMDEIFGPENFRNMITRRKCSSKNFTKHQFANLNDYILFYTKSDDYTWNQPGERPDEEWIAKEYPKKDERGRYKLVPIHAPGTRGGATGGMWRGQMPPPGKHWQYTPDRLEDMDKAGEIRWSRTGNPRRKVYLTDEKQVPYTDYWNDFRDAHHQSIPITGYPTEKNFDMLRMIVGASSNPGDLVVDPFCGSGTTLHAAQELGRRWIGIDQSFTAVKTAIKRFRHGVEAMGDFVDRKKGGAGQIIDLFGSRDADELARKTPRKETNFDFDFMVDEELLNTYPTEIAGLASG
ncbi:site-specific DNA-methyltransferase [Mesorhizobium sp. BR-1-1-10]|uniref:site-specific DNA-methyltransferase n=1 Tax=Mesorhizobium sp. BR-1-1-10 TaxID=2876660 RepID=UPI001CD0D616|nr:site-specific DNA-methyltransferase [Mesorhizobium sp. BR-1-1-10]MBZ9975966.1 site-specific DNA-methyltransferase [Mesorhizobium sp. BR-1-1-10]